MGRCLERRDSGLTFHTCRGPIMVFQAGFVRTVEGLIVGESTLTD